MSRPARLLELVHLLNGRRSRTVQEIVDRFGVSERTAYRDLAELGTTVPLTKDEHGYRLLETATLPTLNLTPEEHALLKVALANPTLHRHDSVREILQKLSAKLDAALANVEESPWGLSLAPVDTTGRDADPWFPLLREAIAGRRTVEMRYLSLSGGTDRWRRLDPYAVFQRDEAWYVAGRCHENAETRIFRLDRIVEAETTEDTFPAPDFDLDLFLADAWRVCVGPDRHDVVLRFHPSLAPLLLRAELHPDATVDRLPDGRIRYRLTVSHLEELARWIVGFGEKVEVVEPKALRELVREIATGVLAANGG